MKWCENVTSDRILYAVNRIGDVQIIRMILYYYHNMREL